MQRSLHQFFIRAQQLLDEVILRVVVFKDDLFNFLVHFYQRNYPAFLANNLDKLVKIDCVLAVAILELLTPISGKVWSAESGDLGSRSKDSDRSVTHTSVAIVLTVIVKVDKLTASHLLNLIVVHV